MGTPFNDIYQLFLSQVKVFELVMMDDNSLEQNMQLWLMSSIGHFGNCRKDLRQHDLIMGEFAEELDSEEKFILAKYMSYAYLLTYVITESNLKQSLNSKDYRMYSPANQLKALQGLRDSLYSEANSLKTQYSYNIHSIKDFFK